MSGNFSEVIDRLHKSLIGLDKTFASFFRKRPERLSRDVTLTLIGTFINCFEPKYVQSSW